MFFITEKETEALLEPETRMVMLPGGKKRSVHSTKWFWEIHDNLSQYGFPAEDITQLAEVDGAEMNRSFDLSLHHVVGYINNQFRKAGIIRD